MTFPLLTTKLFLPLLRAGQVPRPRLLERLDGLLRPGVRLALISGPAGFGKTSLLAEWLSRHGKPAAWLALDAADDNLLVFMTYLTTAIDRIRPGIVSATASLVGELGSGRDALPLATLLSSLVNELAALDSAEPLVIVLDDFQFVTAVEVRDALGFLVENLPPGARLIIATRSDPPLPLSRLRARGQMVELRATDLRFTAAETDQFFTQTMRLRFDPATTTGLAETLTTRTEGWAAGLQMAALVLQSDPQTSAAELLRTFTGSHRFVIDYLVEEVLSRLPAQTVSFLMQTAILDRFCADLCQAVFLEKLSAPRHAETASPEQAILLHLEQSNLFLVALDGERRWFRYHHLFSDLLRARLKQAAPEKIHALHRRAAAWFERSDLIAEAIHHALSAAESGGGQDDYENAARLVENHSLALLGRGELHAMLRWISLLPPDFAARRPWLAVYQAWVYIFRGQMDKIEPLLHQAEAAKESLDSAAQQRLEGHCAAIRCHRQLLLNDLPGVFHFAGEAQQKLPTGEAWARGFVQWTTGYAARAMGNLNQAADIFAQLFQHDLEMGDPWGVAMVATDLGMARKNQGRLRDAIHVFNQGVEFLAARGVRSHGYTARLLTALASVLYEQNQLGEARKLLEEAVELTQRWRNPNHLVFAYINLARVQLAQQEPDLASHALELAEQQIRELPVVASLTHALEAARASLRLSQGQAQPFHGEREALLQAALANSDPPLDEGRQAQEGLLARELLAQGQYTKALHFASRLALAAGQSGREALRTEALAIQSLAFFALGDKQKALDTLENAVEIAGPEESIRPIADLASLTPGTLETLVGGLKRKSRAASREYLERLSAALAATAALTQVDRTPAESPSPQPGPASFSYVEQLSAREIEVVHLLGDGLTNLQIAARLVISPGTVKAHTANIFRKLDAANRTQAVARAREIGLLK